MSRDTNNYKLCIEQGSVFVNNKEISELKDSSITQNPFNYLWLFDPPKKLYIISCSPFKDSEENGTFRDNYLRFNIKNTDVEIKSKSPILHGKTTSAWIKYEPYLNIPTEKKIPDPSTTPAYSTEFELGVSMQLKSVYLQPFKKWKSKKTLKEDFLNDHFKPGITVGSGLLQDFKYPQRALDFGIEGKVWVGVYRDDKGDIEKINIIEGIGHGCDEVAKEIALKTESPSTKNSSHIFFPIIFKL